jgi:hypothetical protein
MPYKDPERKREYLRQYYADNKERIQTNQAKRHAREYDKLTEQRKRYRDKQVDLDPEWHLRQNLKKYNLTLEEFNQMKEDQKYTCPGCMEQKDLVVDHDHDTGFVRCLLCRMCNGVEGQLKSKWPFLLDLWWAQTYQNLETLKC